MYLLNDMRINTEHAQRCSVLAVGVGPQDAPETIRAFENNEDFAKWAEKTSHGSAIRGLLDDIHKLIPEKEKLPWVETVQRLALKYKSEAFHEFAGLLGAKDHDDIVVRASTTERTALTPKLFDPVLLYDHLIEHLPPTGPPEDPNTSVLPIPSGFWPDLGWVGWNNRARSVRIFGLNALCQNTWFGGRWIWLAGINGLMNLGPLFFDRVSSSVISF